MFKPLARHNQSLGARMVLATLGFCLLFTCTAVAVHTWLAWQSGLAAMTSELELIEKVYQSTLRKAVWDMDRDSIQTHLSSVGNVRSIGHIEVRIKATNRPADSVQFTRPGWEGAGRAPSRTLPLTYQAFPGAPIEPLGELLLIGDERELWASLRSSVQAIVLTQLLQSLLLAGFIMFLFSRAVTVHVRRIAMHLGRLRPEEKSEHLSLNRSSKNRDELAMLVGGVNHLQDRLSDYVQQKQRYENALAEHRDHLADAVRERTAELSTANQALAQSADVLRQIGDIGKELTTSLDVYAICVALHRHLRELLPLDSFGVAMLAARGDRLDLIYYVEDETLAPPSSFMLNDTRWLTVRTFLEDRELVIADEAAESPTPEGVVPSAPMLSALLRPLVANGRRIGVVICQSHRPQAFQERELEILRSTAAYAAIALANASAYASVEASRGQAARALEELKQAQGQLIQSEKMAALGQLVAGVAHEINTPIGAVKSSGRNIADALRHTLEQLPQVLQLLDEADQARFVDLIHRVNQPHGLLSSSEERAQARALSQALEAAGIEGARHKSALLVQLRAQDRLEELLPLLRHPQVELILDTAHSMSTIASNTENINMAVERVAKIIFALKSYSRFDQSEEVVDADLREGLETVLTIYQSKLRGGIELVRHYQDLPRIPCLPDELNQVWTNLIHNALQAMQYKGVLQIRLERDEHYAIVIISDSGCGIPQELIGRIFDPFFTTKPVGEGSGLGLDIVKKIVEKHHGRIELQSVVGVGSSFSVYLPLEAGWPGKDPVTVY
ncbi:ATP-binding protein [Paucibacter sp. Y2R2-4]|uniref:sensor histidine kinase n=1 Tax=Paucibacter sp. Y2R2-4 TaxID=2893553 RepID=UPI0021E4DC57|nr:ATP-binding protein [Paucibacter sp. Y2R2-4]MCV2351532.1 GAF domain-containing protein [Paucibacter sp. Y2R2-4]